MRNRHLFSGWLWTGGIALVIFGARLREIFLYTGDVAINDQWKIEAADLYLPWLDGTLKPWAFLQPHFEHVPMWTRLLAWLEVVTTGRWDPFLQTAVNSTLYACLAVLLIRWLDTGLRSGLMVLISLIVATVAALPHGWENSTWGFQSQFPLALIFLLLHADGSFSHEPGSRGWWRAQAAGFAGLFTLAGMWIAPLAVVAASVWTQRSGPRLRFWPLLVAITGLAIIAYIRMTAPPGGAFAQTAGSPLYFLNALLDLLGWPAGWPGALVIVNLPLVIYALQLRGNRGATVFDRTALALGLWCWGQAAALAFARSADYSGYVSRYGDLLAVGLVANAVALARLSAGNSFRRWSAGMFATVWTAVVLMGLIHLSSTGHSAYFHANSARNAQIRRDAVQAYLLHRDRSLLEAQETRWRLYQDVNQITALLDNPHFRTLLPTSVNPDNPQNVTGSVVRFFTRHWAAWVIAGAFLAIAGLAAGALSHTPRFDAVSFPLVAMPWLAPLAAGTCLVTFILLHGWPSPYLFDSSGRWWRLIYPGNSTGLLTYSFEGNAPVPVETLKGAVPLYPEELRRLFYGSAPAGPGLTGTILSSSFKISSAWLVVPYAGYPVAHGNGLRVRIYEPDGRTYIEIACMGPNSTDLTFWAADVRHFMGRPARLVLYDGRTDTEAWVAAAPPIATSDPDLARRLEERLRLERIAFAHSSLGIIFLASGLALFGSLLWRQ